MTAQPNEIYFLWQLEIQLRNLASIGVVPNEIHVLLAIRSYVDQATKLFIEQNKHLCEIYLYPDKRIDKRYVSSIRPHIVSQHFVKNRYLEQEVIFYFDSDVLFKEKIDTKLFSNDKCYVSNTKAYINSDYIIEHSSFQNLKNMADIVQIPVDKIIGEKDNSGGAQYLLKCLPLSFWNKVEEDSINLYLLLNDYNNNLWNEQYEKMRRYRSEKRGIEAWCADMWAVLWNLWYFNKKVEIHELLDFLWPDDDITKWGEKKILHYTGFKKNNNDVFDKTRYYHKPPWYHINQHPISVKSCSYIVYHAILNRKKEMDERRPLIANFVLILKCLELCQKSIKLFSKIKTFYEKYLDINICLFFDKYSETIEPDGFECYNKDYLDSFVQRYNNCSFIICEIDLILDPQQLLLVSTKEINKPISLSIDHAYNICPILLSAFFDHLDFEFLELNKGKFDVVESNYLNLILCSSEHLYKCLVYNSVEESDQYHKDDIYRGTVYVV